MASLSIPNAGLGENTAEIKRVSKFWDSRMLQALFRALGRKKLRQQPHKLSVFTERLDELIGLRLRGVEDFCNLDYA